MELTREESKRILRRIELEAYSALVTALRAQGELDRQKKRLLRELGEQLSISTERHRAEIRRAISDDRLSMIAECVCGSDASVEWESEGRRVVPLMPRLVPQTAFTGSATAAANHAASVNSTIPSTAKGRPKDVDEDFKSRKRQRTTSPATIQKVIVSSAPKTLTATVRNNNAIAKDTSRFLKTPTLPVKQDSSQLSPMKMTSSGSAGVPSKPIIIGGTKSSSVSVAPSKYVAPLPASCLQAHASVVSGIKTRMNLNVVKTKPKPKFKPLAASVKIRPAAAVHGASTQGPSVAQTLAQSLLTAAKIKRNEIASSTSKTVQVSRSTSTITVAPRSSISLTAFKTTIQPKPQSPAGPVLGKAVSVSRRPLPAIFPKTIPSKALTAVSSPGRKLASILPAPAKSMSSTFPSPRIVPVVASSASSPIPIAPSPRPPQPFTAGLSSSIMNKVTTVSMATGQSADLKRNAQDTSSIASSELKVKSPVLFGKSPAGSRDSSPMSSKSLDNIHEREALSPVNEILTLVTSPSSVPFVPSSPVKSTSTPLTSGEISLECEENLLEDLIKDEEIQIKKRTNPPAQVLQKKEKPVLTSRKDVLTSSNLGLVQNLQEVHQDTAVMSDLTSVVHSLQELNKSNPEALLMLKDTSTSCSKTAEIVAKPIDLSPLVDELISSNPFDFDERQLENLDLVQSASGGDTCDVVGVESNVNDIFVGGLPVLDVGSDLSDVSETVKLDVGDVISAMLGENGCPEQSSSVAKRVDTNIGFPKKELAAVDQQEGFVDSANKSKEFGNTKKGLFTPTQNVPSATKKQAESNPVGVNLPKQVEKVATLRNNMGNSSESKPVVPLKDIDELRDNIIETSELVKALDEQRLFQHSNQEERALSDLPNVAGVARQGKNNIPVTTADTTPHIPQDAVSGNTTGNEPISTEPSSRSVNISSESIKTTEDKRQQVVSDSNLGSEVKNPENKINTIEAKRNEIVESIPDEKKSISTLGEGSSKDDISYTITAQAEEISQTNMSQSLEVIQDHSSKHDEGRLENIEEQLSGSEAGSLEGGLVRTSNRKRKAPPPRDLSLHPPGWVRSALQLLQKVARFRGSSRSKNARSAASWFLKPVAIAEAPGYYKVIKCPMDFGTIKAKLEASEYISPADFHRDMLLVKSNCCKYNPPGHVVRKDCDEVFLFYEAEYERFVEKLDKIYLSTPKKQKSSPV